MVLTRRGMLALAGVGLSDVLGGCFGTPDDGSNGGSGGGSDGGGGSSGGGGKTPTPKPTPTATPEPDAEFATLAERTGSLWAELDWFATQYDRAIREYRVVINRIRDRIGKLDAATGITTQQVDDVEADATRVAEYVEQHLASHFEVDPALLTGTNVYVNNLRKAVERGDREAQRSAVEQLRLFYQRVSSGVYIRNELSDDPIYDTLYSELLGPKAPKQIFGLLYPDEQFFSVAHPDLDKSTASDGVPQHTHEFAGGYVVYAHAHKHPDPHFIGDHHNEPDSGKLYAYKDGGISILKDTKLWRKELSDFEPVYDDVFAPVRHADREAAAYVTVNNITSDFTELPVYVQKFGSVTAARDARDQLFQQPLDTDGTATLTDRPWDRIYYPLGDATMYAYLVVAGEFVVTALPWDRTWEHTSDQFARLGKTWLGISTKSEK